MTRRAPLGRAALATADKTTAKAITHAQDPLHFQQKQCFMDEN